MSRVVVVSLLAVALLIVPAGPSVAGGHGGGGHGGHGFHGHHGSHGHFHGHGVIVAGPFWWGPWWDPWWSYPPYYYQPQVIVQPAPIYTDSPAPPESYWSESYWYYCPSAGAYYPTVPTCPEVWIKVPPRTQ